MIFKLQGENSILLLILKYFSNLDKSTIQHRPSDLSEYKVLMLIFQIEVKYEFVTKIIKSSDQKGVKCLKLKILWGFWTLFVILDLSLCQSVICNTVWSKIQSKNVI